MFHMKKDTSRQTHPPFSVNNLKIARLTPIIDYTWASNLAYPAPQDNFLWVSTCLLGRLDAKQSCPKIFGIGYVKMHGFHGNPLYDSQKWG